MVTILSEQPGIAGAIIGELRCIHQQADPLRFRYNLERIGECLGYEISKSLHYETASVETPLGIAEINRPAHGMVLGCILRAGLPMHTGLLRMFDRAENAFVSAYRRHHKDGTFDIRVEYVSCPSVTDKVLILADPMLATGSSMVKAVEALTRHGRPESVHIAVAIAAREGLDYARRLLPEAHFWVGALDEELTAKAYIVPGLGDAGDLAFGAKLQE